MLLLVASSALAGCTILHSSTDPADGGIAYHLPRSVVVAKVDLWKIENKQGEADDEYVVTIDNSKGSGRQSDATRAEIIPDLRERYVLTYNSNPFFYDRYCVLTTENGLLSSVEYATEDKTPNIVLALSELGRKLGTGFARTNQPLGAGTDPVATATVTFNPFDPADRDAAAQVINNSFRTQHKKVNVRFDFPELHRFGRNRDSNKCRADRGLCFRTKVKTPMRLLVGGQGVMTVLVDVVNPHFVGHFDLDRAFMVEKVVRLGFDNGALNQVIMRKPSEVLQTVKLPLAVVDAILSVPANFIANAGGTTQAINKELRDQRKEIDELHAQLAAGAVADEDSQTIYRPRCKGRTGLLNPNAT